MGSTELAEGSIALAGTLRSLVERQDQVVFAYLFGSHARGRVSCLSDIDIAVYFVGSDRLRCHELKTDLYMALSRGLGTNDIDIVVLNMAANLMLLDEIIRCGVLLVDKAPDLREEYEQKVLHRAIDFKTQRKAFLGA
jgi:uncharacterized protein